MKAQGNALRWFVQGPFGARSRCFGDRLIRMDQNSLANSFTFGARENRMNPFLA